MSANSIVVAVLALAIGFGVGAAVFRSPPPPDLSPELREKFQHLTAADIEDYYRLKTAEEKFQKADEILGKIMTIFLADLGLHVSQQAVDASRQKFQFPSAVITETRPPKHDPAPPAAPPKPSEPLFGKIFFGERQLFTARTIYEVEAGLAKAKIDQFGLALAESSAQNVTPRMVSWLNGTFSGRASVDPGGRHHEWDVAMEIHAVIAKGQLKGSASVRLSENGQQFSKSTNNGGQNTLRGIPQDISAVLVQADPGTQFQLYNIPDMNQVAGNVYSRESDDKPFVYIGTVVLNRL